MCDTFSKQAAQNALAGKSLLFIGDSIMRNIYKDLVWLCSNDTRGGFIPQKHMRDKGESRFLGDVLTLGSALSAAREYKEDRDFYRKENDMQLTFIFITRCYSDYLEDKISNYKKHYGSYPDFIIVNSALWDINRWGPSGISEYRKNIFALMRLFQKCLPSRTQVVWMTTPPISAEVRGGFMIPNLEFVKQSMRFNIMEGNKFCAHVVAAHGYDVLDMHFFMLNQIHRRAPDGIHWNFDAVRMQTNIVLTHFCLGHEIPLPREFPDSNGLLQTAVDLAENAKKEATFSYPFHMKKRKSENDDSEIPSKKLS